MLGIAGKKRIITMTRFIVNRGFRSISSGFIKFKRTNLALNSVDLDGSKRNVHISVNATVTGKSNVFGLLIVATK
jgi:hypothetical protein